MITCLMVDGKPTDVRDIGGPPNMTDPDEGQRLDYAVSQGRLLYRPAEVANIKASHWEIQGIFHCVQVVDSVWSQAELDAQAAVAKAAWEAMEAERKARPIPMDQPLEVPLLSILSQSAGKGVGVTATDEGDLVTVIVHESPWPDKATLDAKVAAAISAHRARKDAAKAGING